jgi:hypothetical protein
MDYAFWDPLMVEMEELFAKVEILQQGWTTRLRL